MATRTRVEFWRQAATLLLAITALLHIFAFVVSGFNADSLSLIPVGLVYLLLAAGLWRRLPLLPWITATIIAIGMIAAIIILFTAAVPMALTVAFIAIDAIILALLVLYLW